MKRVISLNGSWKLAGFEPQTGNWMSPESLPPKDFQPIDALVPGDVYVDLMRAGRISDPYYGLNAKEAEWVGNKEWWYKRDFDIEQDFLKKRTFLEFDGLRTHATVFLNGIEVGKAFSSLMPYRFDVSQQVQLGRNTVAVKFEPNKAIAKCNDFSIISSGIWKDARVVSYDLVSISNVRIEPEIEGGYANAWITVEVENHSGKDQDILASIVLTYGEEREKLEIVETVTPFGGVIDAVVRIEEPRLWWPNGLGEQHLYNCMVGLQVEGEIQDVAEQKFGIRDVKLIRKDEEGNEAFALIVNGTKVFCKGASLVPADYFVSKITNERCKELVEFAKNANFNMLRAGSYGMYESQWFYDACDEAGIMIWQDLAPVSDSNNEYAEFNKECIGKVINTVKRLRNHPSVVLWYFNSNFYNTFSSKEISDAQDFSQSISNLLGELDNTRPYCIDSQFAENSGNALDEYSFNANSCNILYKTNIHQWRHMIEEETAPFISSFSAQGSPAVNLLKLFIPEEKLFPPDNEIWEFHHRDAPYAEANDPMQNNQILFDLTKQMMGEFENIEQFSTYSGILQGELLKAKIEHYRREKQTISGALLWKLNDSWPAISSSIIDYYLRPKIAYYYVKRAFAPLIMSFKQCEDFVQLYITSDYQEFIIKGKVRIGIISFGEDNFSAIELPVEIQPNISKPVWESDKLGKMFTQPSRQCLAALLKTDDGKSTYCAYLPLLFKDMEFPKPKLYVQRHQVDESTVRISITPTEYARNIELSNLPAHCKISDNFFDILPRESHVIDIEQISIEEAKNIGINVWGK